jgi:hypothetical protein
MHRATTENGEDLFKLNEFPRLDGMILTEKKRMSAEDHGRLVQGIYRHAHYKQWHRGFQFTGCTQVFPALIIFW